MVLAPEHRLVEERARGAAWPEGTPREWRYPEASPGASGDWTPAAAVREYREVAARLTDVRREQEGYQKTGVFTGAYAVNPMTGELLPVFVADYVLMGYGTGAIMAVPAHDQRDLEFAQIFGLPVRPVLQPPAGWFDGHGISPDTPAARWPEAYVGEHGYLDLNVPGLDLTGLDSEAAIQAAIDWLAQHGAGRYGRAYRLRDWLVSRQRHLGGPFPAGLRRRRRGPLCRRRRARRPAPALLPLLAQGPVRPGLCVDQGAVQAAVQPGIHPGGRLPGRARHVRSGGRRGQGRRRPVPVPRGA